MVFIKNLIFLHPLFFGKISLEKEFMNVLYQKPHSRLIKT